MQAHRSPRVGARSFPRTSIEHGTRCYGQDAPLACHAEGAVIESDGERLRHDAFLSNNTARQWRGPDIGCNGAIRCRWGN